MRKNDVLIMIIWCIALLIFGIIIAFLIYMKGDL